MPIKLIPTWETRAEEQAARTREALANAVTRYVPTYINKDGMRTLMGRHVKRGQ